MYKTWVSLPRDKWEMLDKYGSTNTTINAMINLVVNYYLIDEIQYHDTVYNKDCIESVKRTVIVNNPEYEDLVDTVGHRNVKYSLQRLVNLVIDEGLIEDAMTSSQLVVLDNKEDLCQTLENTINGLSKLFISIPEIVTHQAIQTLNALTNYRSALRKLGTSNENKV